MNWNEEFEKYGVLATITDSCGNSILVSGLSKSEYGLRLMVLRHLRLQLKARGILSEKDNLYSLKQAKLAQLLLNATLDKLEDISSDTTQLHLKKMEEQAMRWLQERTNFFYSEQSTAILTKELNHNLKVSTVFNQKDADILVEFILNPFLTIENKPHELLSATKKLSLLSGKNNTPLLYLVYPQPLLLLNVILEYIDEVVDNARSSAIENLAMKINLFSSVLAIFDDCRLLRYTMKLLLSLTNKYGLIKTAYITKCDNGTTIKLMIESNSGIKNTHIVLLAGNAYWDCVDAIESLQSTFAD